jgi:hypothetical protein
MEVTDEIHVPAALPPRILWIGGWVCLGTYLEAQKIKISCPCRESNTDSSDIQLIAWLRYFDS